MVLLLSDLDDSEKKSCKEADDADTPDSEEAVLDMVFDLYICEADTKKCCRYNRADECCTVTADYHNNSDVCRNYKRLMGSDPNVSPPHGKSSVYKTER